MRWLLALVAVGSLGGSVLSVLDGDAELATYLLLVTTFIVVVLGFDQVLIRISALGILVRHVLLELHPMTEDKLDELLSDEQGDHDGGQVTAEDVRR